MTVPTICPASMTTPGPRHDLAPADPHCRPPKRRCGWVVCRACGAVVDPRRGLFTPGPGRPQ